MEWLSEKQRAAARAYADSGMNVAAAARKLGVSADTVRHHLEQIRKRTGRNPKDFWDLAQLLGAHRKEDAR